MNEKVNVYNSIEHIMKLIFKCDDLMDQEVLFELHDYIAQFALDLANQEGPKTVDRLVKKFPYLYTVE